MVHRLLRDSELPRPELQHEVRLGARLAYIDFAYPEQWLGVEADGYEWHAGRDQWADDLARRNALVAAGWTIIHVTSDDVTRRPRETVALIQSLLDAPTR